MFIVFFCLIIEKTIWHFQWELHNWKKNVDWIVYRFS